MKRKFQEEDSDLIEDITINFKRVIIKTKRIVTECFLCNKAFDKKLKINTQCCDTDLCPKCALDICKDCGQCQECCTLAICDICDKELCITAFEPSRCEFCDTVKCSACDYDIHRCRNC